MIKLRDLIVESQKFDIEGKKKWIIRFVDKIRKGGESDRMDRDVMYAIVTNTGVGAAGISKNMGYKDDVAVEWKKYFGNSSIFRTDGVWSQRDFNHDKRVKVDGKTYNYYITIDRGNKSNVMLFWNKLNELDKALREFSDKRHVAISYKTHVIFDMFLSHNDSLKIYYYDSSLKNDIESIVKKWVRDTNIKLSDRSHTHGVDKTVEIHGEEHGGSYGTIVANIVMGKFIDVIKANPKGTDEQFYNWIKKNLIVLIKKITVKGLTDV
jgi:hypothetical protein